MAVFFWERKEFTKQVACKYMYKILNTHTKQIPPSSIAEDKCIYLRPLPSSSGDLSRPWFANQPVGKHAFAIMVKEAWTEAGITGKTNHSLWAMGASTMFNAGVTEKVIKERTG